HAHAAHRCTSSVRASLAFLPGFDVSIKPGAGQYVLHLEPNRPAGSRSDKAGYLAIRICR
ncbi:hypothetical protein ABT214_03970, partial [Micromonospora purpureochromogenes]|uniref:hypothetical protein n=1 Tax=Micromonospora purpureochromogenes TaxID=47872 RepID=UPI00332F04BC